jgi:hypothetical protein
MPFDDDIYSQSGNNIVELIILELSCPFNMVPLFCNILSDLITSINPITSHAAYICGDDGNAKFMQADVTRCVILQHFVFRSSLTTQLCSTSKDPISIFAQCISASTYLISFMCCCKNRTYMLVQHAN